MNTEWNNTIEVGVVCVQSVTDYKSTMVLNSYSQTWKEHYRVGRIQVDRPANGTEPREIACPVCGKNLTLAVRSVGTHRRRYIPFVTLMTISFVSILALGITWLITRGNFPWSALWVRGLFVALGISWISNILFMASGCIDSDCGFDGAVVYEDQKKGGPHRICSPKVAA